MIDRAAARAGLILQARMGSSRLPGKTLMPLAGAPLLQRILERVQRCNGVDVIVVATTTKPEDDAVAALARDCGVEVFRGSDNDLVDRYLRAAEAFQIDVIVRLPADNPVPEPAEIDRIVSFHRGSAAAFSSNLAQVLGNGYPDGIGAEVFDRIALSEISKSAKDPQDREHPHRNFFDYATQTPRAPQRYAVGTVQCPAEFRRPDLVLDVNTREQYDFMARLYADLYPGNPRFHITDIVRWYDEVWSALPNRRKSKARSH
jgi:spore coat polysaccharide biosynthesis protein SpsF